MTNTDLQNQKQQIDELISLIDAFSGDPYEKQLLTHHLCIRVSGFLENCVRIIFTNYATPRSQDHVSTFILNKLKKFPNPTYDNILGLTKSFCDAWKRQLQAGVSQQQRASLLSINTNRNAIAHGQTSTITLRELSSYYSDVVQIIEQLENTCV